MKAQRETEKTRALEPAAAEQDRPPPTRTLNKLGKTKLMNDTTFTGSVGAEPSAQRRKSKQED
jgi:hypothetical protein